MNPKNQKSVLSTWDKFKRNRDNTNEVKLFSFENIIEISSLISSECMRNVISSLNTTTWNPALGLHMEDFREQITAMYLKKNNIRRFQQKKQTLQDL